MKKIFDQPSTAQDSGGSSERKGSMVVRVGLERAKRGVVPPPP